MVAVAVAAACGAAGPGASVALADSEAVGNAAGLQSRGGGRIQSFGGNLLRQPYMKGRNHRVVGELANADIVTERTFWIGIYPGLGTDHL